MNGIHDLGGMHGVERLSTRRTKPRDKAKVEARVLLVESWILAALHKRRLFGLAELNQAITELADAGRNAKQRRRVSTRLP